MSTGIQPRLKRPGLPRGEFPLRRLAAELAVAREHLDGALRGDLPGHEAAQEAGERQREDLGVGEEVGQKGRDGGLGVRPAHIEQKYNVGPAASRPAA